jgi:thermolysin
LAVALLARGTEAAEVRLAAVSPRDAAAADSRIAGLLADGRLVQQGATEMDSLGRKHERFIQQQQDVPVWGSGLTRQSDRRGVVSSFGSLYDGIGTLDVKPAISADGVRTIAGGAVQGEPKLYIYPTDDGRFLLTWRVRTWIDYDLVALFIDAHTGLVVHRYSDLQTSTGLGTGVLGDRKKMSTTQSLDGNYVALDLQRPAQIETYDLRGSLALLDAYYDGIMPLTPLNLGTSADDNWTDGATVDAHTYAGWTYDYYYKEHGRHGINGADLTMISIVNPVSFSDIPRLGKNSPYFANAFWDGYEMVYGIGLPGPAFGYTSIKPLAGALEIVAHELTHGVTQYSSGLIYENESGALNEGFSDIMGVSTDFFQNPNTANYTLAEGVFIPGGIRSLQNPHAYGDPDHYSIRYTGTSDNGGVHTNSAIASHAFYLAIEGGTNRVSGISVTGVGRAHRDQISKAFYRAFTFMLAPSARFSDARAATIQSARDLYGDGSPAVGAVTQAWNAVGVN